MFPFLVIAAIVGYIFLSNSKSAAQIANANSQPVYNLQTAKKYVLIVGAVPGTPLALIVTTLGGGSGALGNAFALGTPLPTAPVGSGIINGVTVDEWYIPIVPSKNMTIGDLQSVFAEDTATVIGAMAG